MHMELTRSLQMQFSSQFKKKKKKAKNFPQIAVWEFTYFMMQVLFWQVLKSRIRLMGEPKPA